MSPKDVKRETLIEKDQEVTEVKVTSNPKPEEGKPKPMATGPWAPAPNPSPMAVDVQACISGELAGDLRVDGRSHSRFMGMMDRVYLSEYLGQTATVGEKAGQLTTFSHVPYAQPWSPTTR